MVRLGSIARVQAWFTDRAPPPELAAVLAEAGTRVFVAEGEGEGAADATAAGDAEPD
jgi:DeoR family glycerol-3-phosphate regulon repressor